MRRAVSLLEALVVIAIIAVLVGILLPAVQRVRAAAARARCQSNLKQIGVAFQQQCSAYGSFPAGVTNDPKYMYVGWRVFLLPIVCPRVGGFPERSAQHVALLFGNPPRSG